MPERYPFTDEHVAYYCKRAAQNSGIKTIWEELQDRSICGCTVYTGSYDRFVKRVNAIRPEQIESYRINAVATPQQQIAFLSQLISSGNGSATDKIRALEAIRSIQAEIVAADPTKLKDGRTLLTNPNCVQLTPQLLEEMILMSREIIGGLDKLDYSALNLRELELLEAAVRQERMRKTRQLTDANTAAEIDATTDTDELVVYETRAQFIYRLRREIQTLTDEEIAELERENDDAERDANRINRETEEITYRREQARKERDNDRR